MPGKIRKTRTCQSRPVSCSFCRTRKLRCSRDAPCSNCTSRGIRCELEEPLRPPDESLGLNSDVARRLKKLEDAIGAQNMSHEEDRLQRTNGTESDVSVIQPQVSPHVQSLENDVAWLESIYVPQNTTGRITSDKLMFKTCPVQQIPQANRFIFRNDTSSVASAEPVRCVWLPEFDEAQILLQVFFQEANQLPYITHLPSLAKTLEDVYTDLSMHRQISPGQLLLVLGVFVGATQSWTKTDCQRGLFPTTTDAYLQAPLWVKNVEDVLDVVHRATTVSIEGVQGVIISAFVLANIEGLSRRCRSLYSTALLIARELNLHRIDHPSNSHNANTVQAEMGRRLWWYICASDWSIAARVTGIADGTYTCHLRQMCTKKPLNLNDDELFDGMSRTEKPISQPTTMSYSLQRIRLSEIARNAVDRSPLSMASATDSGENNVVDIDTELQMLLNDLPSFFSMSAAELMETYGLSASRAADLVHQSHTIHFLINTQRCTIHLPYFLKGFVDSTYSWSKDVCVKTARLIISSQLNLEKSSMCAVFRFRLSGLLLGVFMASIVLLMDLCVNKSSPNQAQKRKEVAEAFRILDGAKHESETTAKFVDSLTFILRKHKVSPLQQQQQVPTQSENIIHNTRKRKEPLSAYNSNPTMQIHNPQLPNPIDQVINQSPFDVPVPVSTNNDENNESINDINVPDYSSYFGELAHTFEQGDDVGDFDWRNIFSDLDSSLF